MSSESDGEKFMQDMRERIAAAIRDALQTHGVTDEGETATQGALAVAIAMLVEWNGTQLYLALKKSDLLRKAVFAEMSAGATANDLARKYGIAYSTVYKIYKHELAGKREPDQATLPGV